MIAKLEDEVKDLKNDHKAKDIQINNLKLKEGELKGKDDLIGTLNRNNEKIQQ